MAQQAYFCPKNANAAAKEPTQLDIGTWDYSIYGMQVTSKNFNSHIQYFCTVSTSKWYDGKGKRKKEEGGSKAKKMKEEEVKRKATLNNVMVEETKECIAEECILGE